VLRLAFKSVVSRKARLFLTSLAVILGTSFLAGATIFTDTLNKTFDTLFAEVFQEVDGFVRSTDVIETDFGGEERARISIDYVDRITSVPGVADAQGFIQTFARIVGKDGKPIGSEGNGPPTFGGTFNTGEIELWGVSEGRAPTNGNEVMLDESSAKDAGYVIGDTVKVTAAAGSREFTMVGIANYGDVPVWWMPFWLPATDQSTTINSHVTSKACSDPPTKWRHSRATRSPRKHKIRSVPHSISSVPSSRSFRTSPWVLPRS